MAQHPRPAAASAATPSVAGHGFGTAPVFLASISTILGAILFLRFGYAVGHVGLWGSLMIVLIGHLVTIPTVLAVSEIATNRRVAGGGAYYIISRSFGTNIGGAIGIALYLSQAISIAFYLVAFAEAFDPVYEWAATQYEVTPDPRWISLPCTLLLMVMMLTVGAKLGVGALWVVSAMLGVAISTFLLGQGPESIRPEGLNLTTRIEGADSFGIVFATCFPAFTGMIAGLGLSGDLKNPQKSIPLGTIGATLAGMVVYALVAIKLAQSATPEALAADQFIMAKIAFWGPAIYVGLGAAAFSSALGSILVAPRTASGAGPGQRAPGSKTESRTQAGPWQSSRTRGRDLRIGRHRDPFRGHWRRGFHRTDPQHVLHGDLRRPLHGLIPRILRRQSLLPSHLPFPLVPVPSGSRDVRVDDDPDEPTLRVPGDFADGGGLLRIESNPQGGSAT